VVVLNLLHVLKEFCILKRDCNLCSKGFEPRFIFCRKCAAPLIQSLCNPDDFTLFINDWSAQDGSREEAGLPVKSWVETQIGVGVRNVDGFSSGKNGASDSSMIGEADLANLCAHGDTREKLSGPFVM